MQQILQGMPAGRVSRTGNGDQTGAGAPCSTGDSFHMNGLNNICVSRGVSERVLGCLETSTEPPRGDVEELRRRVERLRGLGGAFAKICLSDRFGAGKGCQALSHSA
jgi:hypothetical protein